MVIDADKLRKDVLNYYGTAMYSGYPMAVIEVADAETASPQELVDIAQRAGFNLRDYAVDDYER